MQRAAVITFPANEAVLAKVRETLESYGMSQKPGRPADGEFTGKAQPDLGLNRPKSVAQHVAEGGFTPRTERTVLPDDCPGMCDKEADAQPETCVDCGGELPSDVEHYADQLAIAIVDEIEDDDVLDAVTGKYDVSCGDEHVYADVEDVPSEVASTIADAFQTVLTRIQRRLAQRYRSSEARDRAKAG